MTAHAINPHITAAAARAIVRLPDGVEGVLMHVDPTSGRCKVLIGGRRRRGIPCDDLTYTGRFAA